MVPTSEPENIDGPPLLEGGYPAGPKMVADLQAPPPALRSTKPQPTTDGSSPAASGQVPSAPAGPEGQ